MNEKCPDTRRIVFRIKFRVVPGISAFVAPKKRPAPAPSSTTDNLTLLLGNEVGAILEELTVNAKDRPQRCLYLCPGVMRCEQ